MPTFSRKRAILIGADKYRRFASLDYSGKDVRDISKAFRDSLQFRDEDILEFTVESQLKPERTEILHNIGEFLKGPMKEDELLVFFFSGHGMIDEKNKKDFLLPIDASPNALTDTGLDVKTIADTLGNTGCANIVMFIDACREEVRDPNGAKSPIDTTGAKSVGHFSEDVVKRDGMVTFFSCAPQDRSYEIADLKNGSFTHCLLKAIASGECSTVEQVDNYLRSSVPPLEHSI